LMVFTWFFGNRSENRERAKKSAIRAVPLLTKTGIIIK
jgi:hypothetical protein